MNKITLLFPIAICAIFFATAVLASSGESMDERNELMGIHNSHSNVFNDARNMSNQMPSSPAKVNFHSRPEKSAMSLKTFAMNASLVSIYYYIGQYTWPVISEGDFEPAMQQAQTLFLLYMILCALTLTIFKGKQE